MKDVTSTSFGLLIAFLLPGLVGLYGLSSWFPGLRTAFSAFLTAQSNVGLFLILIMAALAFGLLVTLFRWLLFECWLCRVDRLKPDEFAGLGVEAKLEAFRADVDEHYRYHQFWGSMVFAMPLTYAGWLKETGYLLTPTVIGLSALLFVGIEFVTGAGAVVAYRNYVRRARQILKAQS